MKHGLRRHYNLREAPPKIEELPADSLQLFHLHEPVLPPSILHPLLLLQIGPSRPPSQSPKHLRHRLLDRSSPQNAISLGRHFYPRIRRNPQETEAGELVCQENNYDSELAATGVTRPDQHDIEYHFLVRPVQDIGTANIIGVERVRDEGVSGVV